MSRAPVADRRAPQSARLSGVLLVVSATALFGTIGTARVLGPDVSSWSVGGLRLGVAAVALVVVAGWLDGHVPFRSLL
ncbi:MAG TPA: hypothetical protein VFV76_16955, partial [Actinomycetes bacterium]|nr:hypothetical protein [Actinomycetes bacterium]